MNFDKITASITPQKFKEILLRGQYEQLKRWYPSEKVTSWMRGIEQELSSDVLQKNWDMDVLTNISYFARAISQMHPGWEKWDENPVLKKDKERFEKAIENLYNQQSSLEEGKRLKRNDLLAELYKIAGILKDNHLEVFATKQKPNGDIHYYHPVDQKTKLRYRPEPKGTVGKNLAFSPEFRKEDRHTRVFHLETGPLVVAERVINGKKTGIIGLSTCMIQQGSPNEASQRHAFEEIVKTLKNNMQNWDNIILDVRGNSGGVPDYLQKIAETICGTKEKLPTCVEAQARKTEEANLRTQFYSDNKYYTQEKSIPKQYSGKQKVFVLTDRQTASAAEDVYPLLKQYKGTQFVGENTNGCCQYGVVNMIALPCGGALQIGSVFSDYEDGFIEGKGHKPDINCSGHDALQEALGKIACGNNTLQKTLFSGTKKGETFPKWLQNPSWLWHRK